MGPASQQSSDTAVAGVIARPPVLYLACLLLGLALDRVLPLPLALPAGALIRWTVGGGLIVVGLGRSSSSRYPSPSPFATAWSRARRRISSGASVTPTATRRVSACWL